MLGAAGPTAATRGDRFSYLLAVLLFLPALSGCEQIEDLIVKWTVSEEERSGLVDPADQAEATLAEAERAAEEAQKMATAAAQGQGAEQPKDTEAPSPSSTAGDPPETENPPEEVELAEEDQGGEVAAEGPSQTDTAGDSETSPEAADLEDSTPADEAPAADPPVAPDPTSEVTTLEPVNPAPASQHGPCDAVADPDQCTIDRWEGRARHAYQIAGLIDAYLGKARYSKAVPLIRTFLERYPTHGRATRYRRILERSSSRGR